MAKSFAISALILTALSLANSATIHPVGVKVRDCTPQHAPNVCIKTFFDSLAPHFKSGIPEHHVPSLDPYNLARMHMLVDFPGILVSNVAHLKNVFRGLSNLQPVKVSSAAANSGAATAYTLTFRIKQVRTTGRYDGVGSVFSLPMDGNSTYFTAFNNVKGNYNMQFNYDKVKKQGVLVNSEMDLKVEGEARFRYNNLKGHSGLGDAVNEMFNNNVDTLLPLIIPTLNVAYKEILDKYVNKALVLIPSESAEKLFSKK